MIADEEFIINFKLNNAGLHLKELREDDKQEVYKSYRDAGGLCAEMPSDTHYVMDGPHVIFIGNKQELLGFLNSHF